MDRNDIARKIAGVIIRHEQAPPCSGAAYSAWASGLADKLANAMPAIAAIPSLVKACETAALCCNQPNSDLCRELNEALLLAKA